MEMRHLYLPYCIEKQPDGRWVVLNRRYKQLGVNTSEWADYANPLYTTAIKGLTAAKMQALCAPGSHLSETRVYLYNDATCPTDSAANWSAYAARLQILMKLQLADH